MDTPITRRDVLRVGAASAGALGLTFGKCDASAKPQAARACILLMLVGGPSQLETWDPKPNAPAEVRGPFGSIATSVPGIRIGELLPASARIADRLTIIRSVYHDAPAVHEAGLQLLQTGHLAPGNSEPPHVGARVRSQESGVRSQGSPFVILPTRIGNMGLALSNGQSAGNLGDACRPAIDASYIHHLSSRDRDRYGKTAFGDACARSIQLVEQGSRCIVVNMFDTVYDRVTWDCHAQRPGFPSTLDDYRRTLCPTFDRAFSTLVNDLHDRGMLDETLIVAMGEMGRTPRLNANGGRDHWTGCWSIAMAGGGVRGGQVIGASDRFASEPSRNPVRCEQVAASIGHALGIIDLSPATGLFV
ncbi:MAG: DUF1501 domain-containing protein [Planctomycetes bacterium]|nr:DUF1501 domain-containing protein [Planctomycetota bacterium]